MAKPVVGVYFSETYFNVVIYENNEFEVLAIKEFEKPLTEIMINNEYDVLEELLKSVIWEYKLKGSRCIFVLPRYTVMLRRLSFTTPMTEQRLKLTIQNEFKDMTRDRIEPYVYDYMLINREDNEEGVPQFLDVVGAAVPKAAVLPFEKMITRIGLKLGATIPEEASYSNLIRHYMETHPESEETDFCILNIGDREAILYIYSGYGFEVSKAIEYSTYDEDLAGNAALEIMKSINFYGFNKRDSEINRIYYGGKNAGRTDILDAIEATTGKNTISIEVLYEDIGGKPENLDKLLISTIAAGAALQ